MLSTIIHYFDTIYAFIKKLHIQPGCILIVYLFMIYTLSEVASSSGMHFKFKEFYIIIITIIVIQV